MTITLSKEEYEAVRNMYAAGIGKPKVFSEYLRIYAEQKIKDKFGRHWYAAYQIALSEARKNIP